MNDLRSIAQRLLFLVWLALSISAQQVHLAVIPQSTEVNAPADLLTAAFSKRPEIQMLERSALDKIVRERSLALNYSAEALSAARLLGADALFLLEPSRIGTNNGVILRLVAVKPGAIIRASHLRWPIDDAEKWVQSVTSQFAPLLPKIAASEDRLLKVSLLNFRSPSSSAASQLLDRELTTVASVRLAREEDLILLERQQLSALTLEKDLAANTEKFWTGSYMLDGTVNRDGTKPGRVTLDLRLTAPGGATREIHIEGARTDLLAVSDTLANEILKVLQRSSAARFDADAEAAAYLEEAKWALRWQMFPEAIAAADSAWALGPKDLDCAVTRMLAYAQSSGDSPHVASRNSSISRGGISFRFRWPDFPPNPASLPNVRHALQLGQEILVRFPDAATNGLSYTNICETLGWAGELLEVYYHGAELREGNEETLADVRKLAREIADLLMSNPANRPSPEGQPIVKPGKPLFGACDEVFTVLAAYGVYFNETPEETAALYQKLLTQRPTPRYVFALGSRRFAQEHPLFGGWKWDDRKRAFAVHERFAAENIHIPSMAMLLIKNDVAGFYAGSTQVADAREEAIAMRIDNFLSMPESGRNSVPKAMLKDLSPEAQARLEKRFSEKRAEALAKVASLALTNKLSREDQEIEKFVKDLPLPQREKVRKNLRAAKVQKPVGITDTVTNASPVLPRPIQMEIDNSEDAPVLSTPVINVSDFWNAPTNWIHFGAGIRFQAWPGPLIWPLLREGRLWFRSTLSVRLNEPFEGGFRSSSLTTNALVAVNPDTLRYEATPLSRPEFSESEFGRTGRRPSDPGSFEVTSNAFYFVHGASLLRRERNREEWQSFPLPTVNGVLYLVKDRLFLSGAEGIYELLENGAKTKTLASVRRRPAQNLLDDLPSLDNPPIVRAPGGAIRAALQGSLFAFDDASWKPELQGVSIYGPVMSDNLFYQKPDFLIIWIGPDQTEATPLVQPAGVKGGRWSLHRFQSGIMFMYRDDPAVFSTQHSLVNKPPDRSGMNLYFLTEKAPLPVEIPVNLISNSGNFPGTRPKTNLFNDLGDKFHLLDGPSHLLIIPDSKGGFWRISHQEVDGRIGTIIANSATNRPARN